MEGGGGGGRVRVGARDERSEQRDEREERDERERGERRGEVRGEIGEEGEVDEVAEVGGEAGLELSCARPESDRFGRGAFVRAVRPPLRSGGPRDAPRALGPECPPGWRSA
jgi:hypothetical protein